MIMRLLWLGVGWVSLVLGSIGAFLPVMPTVPFLILAVWAFSRSSPYWRDRILHHPKFGPPIKAWRERGVVSRNAKIWAISAMTIGVVWALFLALPPAVIAVQATICAMVSVYLITRPGR